MPSVLVAGRPLADSSPIGAAAALANTPLFAGLGRVELARLAGELEEVTYAPNQVVVSEGEPGDALYLVRAGQAGVLLGDGVVVPLRPGEPIGEMALLSGTTRTATVVARTELVVWRLAANRFRRLLEEERGIALGVAHTLARRLAERTDDLAEVRRDGHDLALQTLDRLDPDQAGVLMLLALRPRWNLDALRRCCAALGHADALARLLADGALVRIEGSEVLVVELVADVTSQLSAVGQDWVARASGVLAFQGDAVAALELCLRGDAIALASRLVEAHADALLAAASPDQVDRWMVRLAAAAPESASFLQAASAARRQPLPEPAHATEAPTCTRSVRAGVLPRFGWTLVTVAVLASSWLLPPPPGLERSALVVLGALAATLPLRASRLLPEYGTALFLVGALAGTGAVKPATALSGFASPAWLAILALFGVAAAVTRSGLLYRAALLSLERLPRTFAVQSLALSAAGLLLSAGVLSGSLRATLAASAARAVADALRFAPRSPGAVAVGLLLFLTFGATHSLFLTASSTALVLHGLLPDVTRGQVDWTAWFLAALAPNALFLVLGYASILLIYRPGRGRPVDAGTIRFQRDVLGPVTRGELVSLAVLALVVVAFVTQRYHGLAPAWIALAALAATFAAGVLDDGAFQRGVNWGLLVFLGVMLGLGGVFRELGIDAWVAVLAREPMQAALASPYLFVGTLAVAAILLHFLVPWQTASPILTVMAIPLALEAGFSPLVPVLVVILAGDHPFLPHLNPVMLNTHQATEGALFSHEQTRAYRWLDPVLRLVALLASVPYWRMLGLI